MNPEKKLVITEPNHKAAAPADGLAGIKQNFVEDAISGFVIFLLALPLSLGIALASGAPASAGVIAAMVGGIVGALLGGSYLTINGPAAGLIAIVIGAVQDLGFEKTLAAFVLAGVLQIVFGAVRAGVLGTVVPGSVIHGMLAAIGAIIIAKQIHVALGVAPAAKATLGLVAEIPHSFQNLNPEVALIAMTGLAIILGFKLFKGAWAKYVPAPLVAVIAGLVLARLFDFDHVGPKYLLNIPTDFFKMFSFPDFSAILTPNSLRWTIALALVASIESLLTATAVDRLDPWGRTSNLNRELFSKGICNMACGFIGGLPIIAEIVRSSANIRNGARSRWANFYHGVFILAFVAAFPMLLREIPLSVLAAILISVGFILAHPSQFLHTFEVGWDHFIAFVTTFAVTVASDLLVGVAAGIVVEFIFNVARGTSFRHLFKVDATESQQGNEKKITVNSAVVFSNFLSLRKKLESNKKTTRLVVDLSKAPLVDHSVLEYLQRFKTEQATAGHTVVLNFGGDHKPVSKHPLAAVRRRS